MLPRGAMKVNECSKQVCKTRHTSRCNEISVSGWLKLALTAKFAWSVLMLNICWSDVRRCAAGRDSTVSISCT